MKLYHGSNVSIETIDLKRGRKGKDFGQGFKNHTTMKVKVFEGYSKEWAEFIMMNRRNKTDKQAHDYDIVYGPIADDKVGLQISRYQLQYIQMDELIRQLSFVRPTFQFFFGTKRAIRLLHKIENDE